MTRLHGDFIKDSIDFLKDSFDFPTDFLQFLKDVVDFLNDFINFLKESIGFRRNSIDFLEDSRLDLNVGARLDLNVLPPPRALEGAKARGLEDHVWWGGRFTEWYKNGHVLAGSFLTW